MPPRLWLTSTYLCVLTCMLSACLSRRLDQDKAPFLTTEGHNALKSRQQVCEEAGRIWKFERCYSEGGRFTSATLAAEEVKCKQDTTKVWDATKNLCQPKPEPTPAPACHQVDGQATPTGVCPPPKALTFLEYCQQAEKAGAAIVVTVQALLEVAGTSNCVTANGILSERTVMSVTQKNLTRLEPFTSFPRLTHLIVGSNQIADLSPLRSLQALRYLDLYLNAVEDVSPLADLPQLEALFLNRNPVKSLASLAKLTQLKEARLDSMLLGGSGPDAVAKTPDNCPPTAASSVIAKFCQRP